MLLWICIFCRLVVKTSSGKTKASVGETKTNADKLSFIIIIIITRYYYQDRRIQDLDQLFETRSRNSNSSTIENRVDCSENIYFDSLCMQQSVSVLILFCTE